MLNMYITTRTQYIKYNVGISAESPILSVLEIPIYRYFIK